MLWFFIFLLSCPSQSPHSSATPHSLNRRLEKEEVSESGRAALRGLDPGSEVEYGPREPEHSFDLEFGLPKPAADT